MIIGLGNIGQEYDQTRHNIGFDVLDAMAKKYAFTFQQAHFAFYASAKIKGRQTIFIKPTTYVNLSGTALAYWLQKEKVSIDKCLVIVDDLSIPIEQVKFKPQGSHGGHNGLKHIEQVLQTQNYCRLRFGIGNNFSQGKQVDFVLGKWTQQENPLIQLKIHYCCNAIEKFNSTPLQHLMKEINSHVF